MSSTGDNNESVNKDHGISVAEPVAMSMTWNTDTGAACETPRLDIHATDATSTNTSPSTASTPSSPERMVSWTPSPPPYYAENRTSTHSLTATSAASPRTKKKDTLLDMAKRLSVAEQHKANEDSDDDDSGALPAYVVPGSDYHSTIPRALSGGPSTAMETATYDTGSDTELELLTLDDEHTHMDEESTCWTNEDQNTANTTNNHRRKPDPPADYADDDDDEEEDASTLTDLVLLQDQQLSTSRLLQADCFSDTEDDEEGASWTTKEDEDDDTEQHERDTPMNSTSPQPWKALASSPTVSHSSPVFLGQYAKGQSNPATVATGYFQVPVASQTTLNNAEDDQHSTSSISTQEATTVSHASTLATNDSYAYYNNITSTPGKLLPSRSIDGAEEDDLDAQVLWQHTSTAAMKEVSVREAPTPVTHNKKSRRHSEDDMQQQQDISVRLLQTENGNENTATSMDGQAVVPFQALVRGYLARQKREWLFFESDEPQITATAETTTISTDTHIVKDEMDNAPDPMLSYTPPSKQATQPMRGGGLFRRKSSQRLERQNAFRGPIAPDVDGNTINNENQPHVEKKKRMGLFRRPSWRKSKSEAPLSTKTVRNTKLSGRFRRSKATAASAPTKTSTNDKSTKKVFTKPQLTIDLYSVEQVDSSAIVIQRAIRRHQAQMQYWNQMLAIEAIQRVWLSYQEQKRIKAGKMILKTFLSHRHARIHENRSSCLRRKQVNAIVTVLQVRYRAHCILEIKMRRKRNAAIAIQSACRTFMAKMHYRKIVRSIRLLQSVIRRRQSAISLQRVARGYQARSQYLSTLAGIVAFQALRRRYQSRQAAATSIQAQWRCFADLQRYSRVYSAIVALQGRLKEYLQRHYAAVCIQKHVRGGQALVQFSQARGASIQIQCLFRQKLAMMKFKAALGSILILQRVSRGIVAKSFFERWRSSAVKLQATARLFLAKKEYTTQKVATIIIQRALREWMKQRQSQKEEDASIRIQACSRRWLAIQTVADLKKGRGKATAEIEVPEKADFSSLFAQFNKKDESLLIPDRSIGANKVTIKRKNVDSESTTPESSTDKENEIIDDLNKESTIITSSDGKGQIETTGAASVSRFLAHFNKSESKPLVPGAPLGFAKKATPKIAEEKKAETSESENKTDEPSYEATHVAEIETPGPASVSALWKKFDKPENKPLVPSAEIETPGPASVSAFLKQFDKAENQPLMPAGASYAGGKQVNFVKTRRKEVASAIIVQKYARAWLTKTRYVEMKKSAIVIQSLARQTLSAKNWKATCKAVLLLQNAFKPWIQKQRLSNAAVKIQKCIRGRVQRDSFQRQMQSLITIQTAALSYLERTKYQAWVASIVTIQSLARCKILQNRFVRTKRLAIWLQSKNRARSIAKLYSEQMRSTVKVQSLWRRYMSIRSFRIQVNAAKVITAVLARNREQQSYLRKRCAASTIVGSYRCYKARQLLTSLRTTAEEDAKQKACLTIVSLLRQNAALKSFERSRKASILLQKQARAWSAVRSYQSSRNCIVCIQKNARMLYAKRCFSSTLRSVVIIQSWSRRIHAENFARNIRRLNSERNASALLIQSFVRLWAIQKSYEKQRLMAIRTQNMVRRNLAESMYAKYRMSATVLQKCIRCFLIRKELERERASAQSQECALPSTPVAKTHSMPTIQNSSKEEAAAQVIQHAIIQYLREKAANRRKSPFLQRQKDSARIAERALQKAAKLRIATYLQNWYRSRKCALTFQSMKESAIIIQRSERRRQGHVNSCATPIIQGGSETILEGHVAPKEESPSDHDDLAIRVNLFSPGVDSPNSTTNSPPAVSPEVISRNFTFNETDEVERIVDANQWNRFITLAVTACLVCAGTAFFHKEATQFSCLLLTKSFPEMHHCPLLTKPTVQHPHYHSKHRHEALSRVRNRNDEVSHNHKHWQDRHEEKPVSDNKPSKSFVTSMEESMMELSHTVVHDGESLMASMDGSFRELTHSVQDWMKPSMEDATANQGKGSVKASTKGASAESNADSNEDKARLSPLAEWEWIANQIHN